MIPAAQLMGWIPNSSTRFHFSIIVAPQDFLIALVFQKQYLLLLGLSGPATSHRTVGRRNLTSDADVGRVSRGLLMPERAPTCPYRSGARRRGGRG